MKVYLLRTNGYNAVVITDDKTAKIFDGATSGKFEGIDLYQPGSEAKLRERYESAAINGTIERNYRLISADHEIPASEIADDLSKLRPVYEMVA